MPRYQIRSINEKFCNAFISKNNLIDFSDKIYLNKDLLDRLL